MIERIEKGFMVFIAEGREGVGAVRDLRSDGIVVYVENAGEFVVPASAVKAVHDQKVVLSPDKLDKALLKAVGHAHDREDPRLMG
jgi:hypothetical protein